jgi:hypothetical protein
MAEAEWWLASTDPEPMVEFLVDKVSDRKFRLFVCACCRSVWKSFADDRSQKTLEVVERFVDGLATEEELTAARSEARDADQKARDALGASTEIVHNAVVLTP